VLPILLLPFSPIIAFTAYVAYTYIHISRELKRIESVKKSPVFVLFSQSLAGRSIIRAFNQRHHFFQTLCKHIDEMNTCHIYLWICNRWLNFRMQCLGACVSSAVACAIVYIVSEHPGRISSSAAGLALMYSLGFSDNLTFLARTHADVSM
jgi:hypothetical protein